MNGIMTPGELMQFITYSGMLYGYVDQLSNLPRRLMDLVTSMERISDIMNQEPDIQDGEKPVELEIQGEIEFQHASFGYKSYLPVLEDVSLKVAKGEMINLIQKALGRLTEGRTTFAIAHRLSTLKDADRLVVINDHHIAEVGSHDELMAQKGIYYGLVQAQLQMQG